MMSNNDINNEAFYQERLKHAEKMVAEAHMMVKTASDRVDTANAKYTDALRNERDNANLLEHLKNVANNAQANFVIISQKHKAADDQLTTAKSDLREFHHRTAAVDSASETPTLCFSAVSATQKKTVLQKLNFEEKHVVWENLPGDLPPYAVFPWTIAKESSQSDDYVRHLETQLTLRNGLNVGKARPGALNVKNSKINFSGTTDVIIFGEASQTRTFYAVIELKKSPLDGTEMKKGTIHTTCELVAACVKHRDNRIVAVLTDLGNVWTLMWLARSPGPETALIEHLKLVSSSGSLAKFILENLDTDERNDKFPPGFADRIKYADCDTSLSLSPIHEGTRQDDDNDDRDGNDDREMKDNRDSVSPKRKTQTTFDNSAAAAAGQQKSPRAADKTNAAMDCMSTANDDDVQRQVADLQRLAGDDGAKDTADLLDLADMVSEEERHYLFLRYIARNIVANMRNVDGAYPYRDVDMDRLFDDEEKSELW